MEHDLSGVAVSFDFDGVLARSPFGEGVLFPELRRLAREAAARTGEPPEVLEARARDLAMAEFRGRTARGEYVAAYDWQAATETVARALGSRFEGSLAELTRDYAERIRRTDDRSALYPGARETLAQLRGRGACLFLLTNGFREYQFPLAQALGLAEHLDAVLAADDLGTVKPFPDAFELAFRSCPRAAAARRYHVGDTLTHDVLGARQSGIYAIWIERALPDELVRLGPVDRARSPALAELLYAKVAREDAAHGIAGSGRPEPEEVRPDAVVVSLREIVDVVQRRTDDPSMPGRGGHVAPGRVRERPP